jgi:predicted phosphate transport protein (TIGR00153 family)
MSLNSLMRWIKPQEQIFFDLLEASAANVLEAARHFDRELRTEDPSHWAELRRQLNAFEHKGDEYTSQILEKMDTTFVTPIEREDLLALAHALDDVVDHLDVIAERLVLYRIVAIRPIFLEISSEVVEGCNLLNQLMIRLRKMPKPQEIRPMIREIHDLENQVDAIYHTALAEIFQEGMDPVELIKWKELLGILETAMDRIELAARLVGSTAMKNS